MSVERALPQASEVTISVVSHGQTGMIANLLTDLTRIETRGIAKLILTLNIPEPLPEMLERLPFETLVLRNPRPVGFGANHNAAFKHCTSPWFAILNPDLRLESDFVASVLQHAEPADALLGPRVLDNYGVTADATRRLLTPWQLVRRTLGQREPAAGRETDWLAGICVILRSEAFAAVGGFDERFYMYLEDADLCLRLRLAGWRIQSIADATVRHAAQRASRHSLRHLRWHLASLAKHWLSATYWRYLIARGGHVPAR
jgi:GT2 family glycosyltransferase